METHPRHTGPDRAADPGTADADRSAMVFPGMGPQDFGSVGKFMLIDPEAARLVAEASDVLGYDLFLRYRDSEADYAEPAQVSFLVVCLTLAGWAEEHLGADPAYCTGPSFGGKAAAVHSGALGFRDAVRLTAQLARYEKEYFGREHPGVLTQSFARTPPEALAEIRAELDELGEWHEISCELDTDFVMLSLRAERLRWLQQRIRAAGGLPLYTVDPPAHCRAFGPLRDRVEAELFPQLTFTDPTVPVVADQDGSVRTTADGVRTMLLDGFVRTVRWPTVVRALAERGVRELHVCGPDSLFGRVPVVRDTFRVIPVEPRTVLNPRRRPVAV
ncbi:ACP S-malonyltransferase [Streptomyces sp. DSM 40712]|uniref:[acyl-carrier-protein] S-malonyltransferase n=1 Tax=Streptomyces lancefieldiae TaxID=3075520 RepID=A0ABU3B0K7_9ACTN|nr:ACP S-malonyltransferase [Streptomyces sp. DSM 40712]MDT0615645.1 ACP S-malonyltransferase [Streptomyces sp. DSM 40712]